MAEVLALALDVTSARQLMEPSAQAFAMALPGVLGLGVEAIGRQAFDLLAHLLSRGVGGLSVVGHKGLGHISVVLVHLAERFGELGRHLDRIVEHDQLLVCEVAMQILTGLHVHVVAIVALHVHIVCLGALVGAFGHLILSLVSFRSCCRRGGRGGLFGLFLTSGEQASSEYHG